mmetsp:Transcript_12090/g.28965  ORF Transcript_12090/g.28965 Transcript_12090/m.28965 type:complete len:231 (-) Transcript_12090:93-785(-)
MVAEELQQLADKEGLPAVGQGERVLIFALGGRKVEEHEWAQNGMAREARPDDHRVVIDDLVLVEAGRWEAGDFRSHPVLRAQHRHGPAPFLQPLKKTPVVGETFGLLRQHGSRELLWIAQKDHAREAQPQWDQCGQLHRLCGLVDDHTVKRGKVTQALCRRSREGRKDDVGATEALPTAPPTTPLEFGFHLGTYGFLLLGELSLLMPQCVQLRTLGHQPVNLIQLHLELL